MQTATLFANDGAQAVRLPLGYHFDGSDVLIQKIGEAVILLPKDRTWETFLHGLNSFSPDYMATGRMQGAQQERETL
jgi:antitoxin VapB